MNMEKRLYPLKFVPVASRKPWGGNAIVNELGKKFVECDEDGIAQRGLIVRLLALPGRVNELAEILIWLRNTLGKGVAVSVMAQYNPVGIASVTPGWNRRITEEEFEPILDLVSDLDFENGWIQPCEDETAECMLGDDMEAGYGEVR